MAQYCKYCAHAFIYGDGECVCEEKEILITEKQASHTNDCKKFELNEMNVFNIDQIYQPRKAKKQKANDGKQVKMERILGD